MGFITAARIHNGHNWLPEGSTLELAEDGRILAILNRPNGAAITYKGILAPGLVNVHCHLELSHMKGLIPEHTGLIPFLKTIPSHRNDFTDDQKRTARHNAYAELLQNGIVAVGDISNTTDTIDLRILDQLHYYTFVESIGFTEANAARAFDYAVQTYSRYDEQTTGKYMARQAIVPHAPYSVSSSLFRLIDGHSGIAPLSIHNQESPEENKFYLAREGGVRDLLHSLGIDDSPFVPSGHTSLQSYLEWLSPQRHMIFVHNTYTSRKDVRFAHNRQKESSWCLCPNANLYIENTLPDIDMLISENASICIGTDSLASNYQLCVLSELSSIKRHYPALPWETLLTWATANGAKALHMEQIIGTVEVGKTPGIVQITGLDTTNKPIVKRVA